jgi:hypothetical protein
VLYPVRRRLAGSIHEGPGWHTPFRPQSFYKAGAAHGGLSSPAVHGLAAGRIC